MATGALSQRIGKAEAALGKPLFVRSSTGLVPNALGAEMMPCLSRGISELASAVTLADAARHNSLTVSVAPIFASRWLVWRLRKFNERFPQIRIRVEPSVKLVDPGKNDVDLCVRVGPGGWTGVNAEALLGQRVFPVCSPEVAGRLKEVSDLAHATIIRENDALHGWAEWLAPHGLSPDILGDGPAYADGSLCLDAAMTGQSVFMAWETLVCATVSSPAATLCARPASSNSRRGCAKNCHAPSMRGNGDDHSHTQIVILTRRKP